MIPKKSTPIKNEILIDIFAKGLLSKDEMRIVSYIIRWSWGFDGKHRRQDYTKELSQQNIADDIGMNKGQFSRVIKKMITEDKMIIKDNCYQFNEHYNKWKVDKSSTLKVDKMSTKSCEIINSELIKCQPKVDKLSTLTSDLAISDKPLPDPKETLKETIKETLKGKNFKNLINDSKEEPKKANHIEFDFELLSWHGVDDDILTRWAKIFPHVEVEAELMKMREFFKKHPGHEKVIEEKFNNNYAIYIFDWLTRAEKWKIEELGKAEGRFDMPETAKGGKL